MSAKDKLILLNDVEGFNFLYEIIKTNSNSDILNNFNNGQMNAAAAYRLLSTNDVESLFNKMRNNKTLNKLHNLAISKKNMTLRTSLELKVLLIQYDKQIKNIIDSEDKILKRLQNNQHLLSEITDIDTFLTNKNIINSDDKYDTIFKYIKELGLGPLQPSDKLINKIIQDKTYSEYFINDDKFDDKIIYKFYFVYLYDVLKQKIDKYRFYINLFKFMLKIRENKKIYKQLKHLSDEEFRIKLLKLYISSN